MASTICQKRGSHVSILIWRDKHQGFGLDGIKLFEHFNKLGERKSVYPGRSSDILGNLACEAAYSCSYLHNFVLSGVSTGFFLRIQTFFGLFQGNKMLL